MLKDKGQKLDAVIELKVDAGILRERIANRVREAQARGEALRPDDNPEVLRTRLEAYQRADRAARRLLPLAGHPEDGRRHGADIGGRKGDRPGARRAPAEAARRRGPKPQSPRPPSPAKAQRPQSLAPAVGRRSRQASQGPPRPRAAKAKPAPKASQRRGKPPPRKAKTPAEVDESALNPYIPQHSVAESRTMPGPGAAGRVSCYRLRTFCLGLERGTRSRRCSTAGSRS